MTELTEPPVSDHLTDHDRAHFKINLRVLDGVADGADPAEIARVVLGAAMDRDPSADIVCSRPIIGGLSGWRSRTTGSWPGWTRRRSGLTAPGTA